MLVRTLHHLQAIIAEMDRRYTLILAERDLRYEQRFVAQNAALHEAASAAKEAVGKAESSVNERLTLLNELRDGVATSDQFEAVKELIDKQDSRIQSLEEAAKNAQRSFSRQVALVTVAVAVIGLIVVMANGILSG